MSANAAHSDNENQVFSMLGVQGTLGTADIQGSAPTLPIGVNPLNGALYVQDLSGAAGTTNIQGTVGISGTVPISGTTVVTGGKLNLASDDSLMLLRQLITLLQASANADVGKRQIVKIGALGGIAGGVEITSTMPVSGAITLANLPAVGGFDSRFQLYDVAKVAYAVGMRANLAFT